MAVWVIERKEEAALGMGCGGDGMFEAACMHKRKRPGAAVVGRVCGKPGVWGSLD